MHPFSAPWKRQETARFSDVFLRQKKGALEANGLKNIIHVKLLCHSALIGFNFFIKWTHRSCRPGFFCTTSVLKNFAKLAGKHLCQILLAWKFIKKETLAQVFSCEFCEISKNTLSYRTPPLAASGHTI